MVKRVPLVNRVGFLAILTVVSVVFFASSTVAQTPTPASSGIRTTDSSLLGTVYTDLYDEVDDFWRQQFASIHLHYASPQITEVSRRTQTGCGYMGPLTQNAMYCPRSQEIILFPMYMDEHKEEFGDYSPIFILAHEWAHHAQHLASIPDPGGNAYELQADCLSGVFARHAERQGWLEPGDVSEALSTAESLGDDPFFSQDAPGAHGTYDQRRDAVMRGMLDGLPGCNFPGVGRSQPTVVPTRTIPTPLPTRAPLPPTPTRVPDWSGPLPPPRLPNAPLLSHVSCFDTVDSGSMGFSELVSRFSGFPDASDRLRNWGWQASAYRQFGCNGPPQGEAGWIDISVHGFSSASSAQQAADYFAAVRQDGTSLTRADGPGVGEYSVALTGPATNGTEFTIYASEGPWLVRVTGVSPVGSAPVANVREVATDVLNAQQTTERSDPPVIDSPPAVPSSVYLPSVPDVPHGGCFRTHSAGAIRSEDVAAAFSRTNAGAGVAETYGWQDGAWVVFTCSDPPPGRAKQLDVSIHQFRDPTAARQVASAVEDFQIPGANEACDCSVAGQFVVCVTAYADRGTPAADIRFVLNQVAAAVR